jgi:cell division protein ZapA (FtsZ GTPase activity inhibitor)
MEKLAVEAAVTTTYNMHHLVHYIKSTEYLQDKVNRISQAWIDADRKRVQEIGKV